MSEQSSGRWGWVATIVAALIGAVATIVAVLIANGTGVITIPGASSTVTVTPSARPAVTVTKAVGTGGAGVVSCPAGQGCTVRNLAAPFPDASAGSSVSGLSLDQGRVLVDSDADLDYQPSSSAGTPELVLEGGRAYSLAVSSPDASKQQCLVATNQQPRDTPIFSLRPGLLICVQTADNGVALLDQTKPLGSSQTLYLRETYWPNTSG